MAQSGPFPSWPTSLPRFDQPTTPEEDNWQLFRGLIVQLYRDENKPLREVRSYLLQNFNFRATDKMFKTRFTRWCISKTVRQRDLTQISRDIATYRQAHNSSPAVFEVNGRYLDAKKVKRSLRRHRLRQRKALQVSHTFTPAFSRTSSPGTSTGPSDDITMRLLPEDAEDAEDLAFPRESTTQDQNRTPARRPSPPISDNSPSQEDLTPEEITTLEVAILQTDFHLRSRKLDRGSSIQCHRLPRPNSRPMQSAAAGVNGGLGSFPETLVLQKVLCYSDVYYEFLSENRVRHDLSSNNFSLSGESSARDFYGRYWLGLILIDKSQCELGFGLLKNASDQVCDVVHENHPHFLLWVCFIICYSGKTFNHNLDALKASRVSIFDSAQSATERFAGSNDPRRMIMRHLGWDSMSRHIALTLLRRTIDLFRQQTHNAYLTELQVLAKLSDYIDQYGDLDHDEIERTLARWAKSSSDIAELAEAEFGNGANTWED